MEGIEKQTVIPFMGGRFILTPAGSFTKEATGEVITYDDNIKLEGVGRFPVKLTGQSIQTIVATYKNNKTFSRFVDQLAAKEIANP